MKKRKATRYAVALIALCAAVILSFAGCAPTELYQATGLSWVSQPKTLYYVGDPFDPSDTAIQITYNNETERTVVRNLKDMGEDEYALENFSTEERAFNKEVTLRVGDLSLNFVIDVITAEDLKTVTFYPENGETFEDGSEYYFEKEVVVGKSVSRPENPVKEGLTLLDWVNEEGAAYNFSAAVQGDLRLHARYFASYAFYNENKLVKSFRVTEGEDFSISDVPALPVKAGYDVAWRFNDTEYPLSELNPLEAERLPLAESFYSGAAKDRRFDAVYIPHTHKVTVDVMGGQINTDEFYEDENHNKNTVLVPYGYTLQEGMTLFDKNFMVLNEATKADGALSGYKFAGWYTKDENGAFLDRIDVSNTIIESDLKIYARWQYGVLFYKARVETVVIEGQNVLVVDNAYELPETVLVDEGKAVDASQIPSREVSEHYGYHRWWAKTDVGNKPSDVADFKNEAATDYITSTVGRPNNVLSYYETFYQIRYTVTFDLGGGSALQGVALTIPDLKFGTKLSGTQVPVRTQISYTKDGAGLEFYGWYLDEAREIPFDYEKNGIDEIYSTTEVLNGTTVGKMTLYADYFAEIGWKDDNPIGASSGTLEESATRLSKNNVTIQNLPALKSVPNYDRGWYYDGNLETPAFDDAGKLIVLKNCELIAKNKAKEYVVAFVNVNTDGGTVDALIENQKVNTAEPMRLPAAYSRWDEATETQIAGQRDATGVWEIEGYYKDAAFAERYSFTETVIDGQTVFVSTETFFEDATVYVRFTRVATEGLNFVSYSGGRDYYVASASGLAGLSEIVVPEKYRGAAVVGIDERAFENYTKLERVYTPDSVKEIRDGAFRGCTLLNVLPKTAKDAKLGEKVYHGTAWYEAEWQKDYAAAGKYILLGDLSADDTTLYEYLGTTAEVFAVPDGVEIIGSGAFTNQNDRLLGVELPVSVRIIRAKAFNGALQNFASVTAADASNLEIVESGAFYRLPNLKVINVNGSRFQSFDNVLYQMENGEKNALVAYPAAREALTFVDTDQRVKTYYIIEESVASIRENAFAMCQLDVVVFRRGRTTAISATTLQSDFKDQFQDTALFYVPYDLNGSGQPVVKSFYQNFVAEFGETRLLPDAFLVDFRSPQAEFTSESGWNQSLWFGFADELTTGVDGSASIYLPDNAETLTLAGIYRGYADGSFTDEILSGTPVFYDRSVYESWTATVTFNARGVPLATFTVPLGATLDAEQLCSIAIPALPGKNSEWSGTFADYAQGGALTVKYFGDGSGIPIRYGGEYTVSDTDMVYHVYMKDPYFADAVYPDFTVTYGTTIPAIAEYVPAREGLQFANWYLGSETAHEFVKSVFLGEGGSVFNEEFLRNYAGAPDANKVIPVYLWARWYVSVSFYQTAVQADGTNIPAKQPSFSVNVDYGSDISQEVRGTPEPFAGYVGNWASYENNVFTALVETDFQNVRANFSVYAHYEKQIVTVTFRAEGNTDVVLSDVGYGETVKELPTVASVPAGKMFDDWYYDDVKFADRFDASRPLYGDTVLYARFVAIPDGADYYAVGAENGAGLILEKVNENEQIGMMQFRLVSAKNYRSSVLYLPTTIRGIGDNNTVTTLGTLTEISAGAFDANGAIEHVIIGTSVSTISVGAFRNTPNLRKITVSTGNQLYKSIDGVLFKTASPSTVLKYPSAKEGGVFTLPEGFGIDTYAFESPVYLNRIVITGGKPTVRSGAFSGMDWANFKIFVPTEQLNSYCNKETHVYDSDWVREITADYIERVFRGSTVTVKFVNTLTGEDFKTVANIPLYGSIEDPGIIADPEGYTFGGWCVDREGINRYVFGKELQDSLTLYARFVRNRTTGLNYTAIASAGGGTAGYEVSIGFAIDKNIVIPNFYNGYPVIKISENGFLEAQITSLEIPYTLETIGSGALVGLGALNAVTLGDLNGNVPSTAFSVRDNVLYNADGTTLVLYPAAYAARTEFTLPSTVTTVGEYAFYGNLALTSIELPASVETIESSAFAKSNLKKLSLRSASRIALRDFNAFSDTSDDFKIFVEHALLSRYQEAGTSWSYVSSKIYSYTAVIRYYMDADAAEAIVEREYETFRIAAEPNYASDAALSVIVTNPPAGKAFRRWTIRETGEVWNFATNLVTRDAELIANWVDATGEEYFTDDTPDQANYATLSLKDSAGTEWTVLTIPSVYQGKPVREIGMNGFDGLKRLNTVVFPASLTRIQKNAFKDCTALTSLTFPESLQMIEESAFENCTALTEVRIPSNLTSISKSVFKNCRLLTTVDFGSANVKTIGEQAFFGCENLLQPSFPASLESIGNGAFEGCIAVARLTLPAKLISLGDRTFFGNSKLVSVAFLGDAVLEIGSEAFRNCTALTDIRLPNGLLQISANTFYGDRSLKSVAIPDSVLYINDGAFRYCTALVSATFGAGVNTIGSYAFSDTALSTVELPQSLYSIGDSAFSPNAYLKKVYLKGELSNIGVSAFGESLNVSIFAENDAVFNACLTLYNFQSKYEKQFMKRWITVTYSYIGSDGAEVTSDVVAESDKAIAEPKISELAGFSYPAGGADFSYRAGYWYAVRETENQTKIEVAWNFATDTVRADTKLTMRYIVSPVNEGESSDGLSFRLLSGDRYEVAGVGSLSNKMTIVIPNYYQKKAVVSIASGFLQNLRAQDAVIVIPETVTQIAEDAFRSSEIARFVIADNDSNANFRVEDGALYQIVSATETKLLRYPSKMTGDSGVYPLRSPSFVAGGTQRNLAYIGEYAFEYNRFSAYSVEAGLPFHVFDDVLYEGAEGVASQALVSYPNLKSLASTEGQGTFTIPSDVNRIYKSALSLTADSKLKKFAVDSGNSVYFADESGVLYRVDNDAQLGELCTLVRMPAKFSGADGAYVVGEGLTHQGNPITVTAIGEGAFENVTGVTTIVFSAGAEDAVPSLLNVNAFRNCSAYFLVDNARYDDFKAKENWDNVVLYKRYSYVTYSTDGAIPQDVANLFLPAGYTGPQNGYVKEVQTITQLEDLQTVANSAIAGLLRMPYSEIEGWYYDAAYQEKVNFGTNSALVKGDMVLYAKWTVGSKASKPAASETGAQNDYFSYYPVVENGFTVSYEIAFRMSSGIAELTELVIPSYHSPDGTEKNRLPVTGFYDDGTDNTKYNGFSKLERIVLPETFRKFRNIFRVKGENIVPPKKLKAIVILSKETSYLNPEHVLQTTTDDLTTIIGFIENVSEFSYCFQDYTTYSAYRQNNVWGSSAGLRGKLLSTVLRFEVVNPSTNEAVTDRYLRVQSGVETLESYEKYNSMIPSFTGYVFDKWEIYSVSIGADGSETLTYVRDADPAATTFGGAGQPQPNAKNDRFVLKAVFRAEEPAV